MTTKDMSSRQEVGHYHALPLSPTVSLPTRPHPCSRTRTCPSASLDALGSSVRIAVAAVLFPLLHRSSRHYTISAPMPRPRPRPLEPIDGPSAMLRATLHT